MTMSAGQRLSHYRLVEKIGEGGMGVVWKAHDLDLGREVAIKMLPPGATRDEARRRMFLDEARLAASVSDARIAQIYELGREGDVDFIVMEYVDGLPLSKLLKGVPLPPERVTVLGEQVARALSRAHRRRLLHRDIKPGNILVSPEGEVKVVDFGLAMLLRSETADADSSATTTMDVAASVDGKVMGTVPYMSPEQIRGERLDPRTDVFSLGSVLYEMTTGRRPFLGSSNAEVAGEILRGRIQSPRELVSQLPIELDRIVVKALASRRSDRYQTLEDLAVDLTRLSREIESGSAPVYDVAKVQPQRSPTRKRARWAWIGAGASFAVVAGLAWLALGRTVSLDVKKVLVLPMVLSGQQEGADYAGLAAAQALAIQLSQSPELVLLPVPEGPVQESERLSMARNLGAGRLLTGMIFRGHGVLETNLSLIDTRDNRIVWGTHTRIEQDDLSEVASVLGRQVLAALGAPTPRLYQYILQLTSSGELSTSLDLAMALTAMRRRDHAAADEATERLVKAFPSSADAWALKAFSSLVQWSEKPTSTSREALDRNLDRLRAIDGDNPYLKEMRGVRLYYEGKVRQALAMFAENLSRRDLAPSFRAWTLGHMAEMETYLTDYDAAEHHLRESIAIDPGRAASRNRLAGLYLGTKRYEDAVLAARQAIALEPDIYLHYATLGEALSREERWAEATAACRKSVELNRSQYTLSMLGRALLGSNQRAAALQTAEEAEILSDESMGCFNLAVIWVLAGDRSKAIGLLRRAIDGGFASRADLENPGLAELRGDPRFESIVAEVMARTAKP